MPSLDRRDLLNGALLGAAAAALPRVAAAQKKAQSGPRRPWRVIDVNVSLFQWPFRRLPYDTPQALSSRLRELGIDQAWASSYEGLLHRDIAGVNQRLADACSKHGDGRLLPFGVVNPALPDWEEDVRRCHQTHRMPGIRLYPNYHGYALDDPRFARLLAMAAERQLLVQLAASMEDRRTQHPLVQVADVDLAPLPAVLKKAAGAKVLLLNNKTSGAVFDALAESPQVYFDIARVEGTDGVARLIRRLPPDRVVFGTHGPFLVFESALIRTYESDLTDDEHRALLEQNAARLIAERFSA